MSVIDGRIPYFSGTSIPLEEGFSQSEDVCLHVATTTWSRDSHELFDYEARQVHRKGYYLKRSAKVFRTAVEVEVIPDGQQLPQQAADFLLSIRQRDGRLRCVICIIERVPRVFQGRYTVAPADKSLQGPQGTPSMLPKKLWLIVKELPSGNHPLLENDVIKLGRFKLRVKQLVKSGSTLPELRLDDVDTPHSVVTPEEAETMQCRICLLDGGTPDDPLVCPCQCKGSIKFVHLDCLRHWINGRLALTDESGQRASFFLKQLACELCKTPFPSAVMLNDTRVPIVKVPKLEPPFIVLEHIVGTANRGLHIISMGARKELKLGRGHESDVRIADVSISRYHATIRFLDGEFVLEDHNSKFGTLVSLRKLQTVEPTRKYDWILSCTFVAMSDSLAVQAGRTVLSLSLRKTPSNFNELLGFTNDNSVYMHESDADVHLRNLGGGVALPTAGGGSNADQSAGIVGGLPPISNNFTAPSFPHLAPWTQFCSEMRDPLTPATKERRLCVPILVTSDTIVAAEATPRQKLPATRINQGEGGFLTYNRPCVASTPTCQEPVAVLRRVSATSGGASHLPPSRSERYVFSLGNTAKTTEFYCADEKKFAMLNGHGGGGSVASKKSLLTHQEDWASGRSLECLTSNVAFNKETCVANSITERALGFQIQARLSSLSQEDRNAAAVCDIADLTGAFCAGRIFCVGWKVAHLRGLAISKVNESKFASDSLSDPFFHSKHGAIEPKKTSCSSKVTDSKTPSLRMHFSSDHLFYLALADGN